MSHIPAFGAKACHGLASGVILGTSIYFDMSESKSLVWNSCNTLVAPGIGIEGRGVIAQVPIKKGQWIDCVPALVIPESDIAPHAVLNCYVYFWMFNPQMRYAVAFGNGSLYNHHPQNNAEFKLDYENSCIRFRAVRDIAPGEEVFINYDYDDEDLVGHPELDWYGDFMARIAAKQA
jgi:uncharacterized protein